jgi:uncharacterized protein YeaO (DUF488 family)
MPTPPEVRLIRVYDAHDRGDAGYRVLVDRLWPRGVARADAALDEWAKDAAPSAELRRWYGHDVQRFEEFARRYRAELARPPALVAVDRLLALADTETLTLVTATRDVEHSGARVLRDHLLSRGSRPRRRRSTSQRATGDAVSRRDRTGDGEEGPQ